MLDVWELVGQYGVYGLVTLLFGAGIAWAIVHRTAAPGKEVRLLWGFASYHKKEGAPPTPAPAQAPPKYTPIRVSLPVLGMTWRLMRPPSDWLDLDLTALGSAYRDTALAGPYHSPCMADLSDLDTSRSYGRYRILRKCPSCATQTLPKNAPDDRSEAKEVVMNLIQQAHLKGLTIEDGLELPVV